MEEFAQAAGHRPDIWYVTSIEVYDYVWAFRQLQASGDGRILHNPTAAALWLKADEQEVMLAPGKTWHNNN